MNYNIKTDVAGTKYYYVNNVLHAIEYTNGTKEWYKNGKLHREDGPAIAYFSGRKEWYKNGKLHREDGPAIEYSNGDTYWYLNNKFYGYTNDFTNKSWRFFIKTLIFS